MRFASRSPPSTPTIFTATNSFRVLAEHLQSGSDDYAMVGFILRNTLSEHGSVARGVCRENAEGYLESITEIDRH